MRLEQYLIEKVTKTEINQIINDSNIMIGSEFEFILPELESNEKLYDLFDEIKDAAITKGKKVKFKDLKKDKKDDVFISYGNEWSSAVKSLLSETNKLPVKYEVYPDKNKSPAYGSDTWIITPDTTLGAFGIELKSPPQPIGQALKDYDNVFEWISNNAKTNSNCGFHTHISLKNVSNLKSNLNIVKLILFTDEGFIYKYFPERVDNDYAQSLLNKVKKEGNITEKDLKIKNLHKTFSKSHYDAINLEHLENNRIEFRYLGGSNYDKKSDKIKQVIAQNAYSLKIACDPNYKHKEYILKLKRFIDKL